jgi:hypothetical protein
MGVMNEIFLVQRKICKYGDGAIGGQRTEMSNYRSGITVQVGLRSPFLPSQMCAEI